MHQNAYMQVLLEIMVVNNPLIKPYVLERWCLLQGCIDSHEGGKELDISSWYITDTSGYLAIRYHLCGLVSKLGAQTPMFCYDNKCWNDSLIEGCKSITPLAVKKILLHYTDIG